MKHFIKGIFRADAAFLWSEVLFVFLPLFSGNVCIVWWIVVEAKASHALSKCYIVLHQLLEWFEQLLECTVCLFFNVFNTTSSLYVSMAGPCNWNKYFLNVFNEMSFFSQTFPTGISSTGALN